MQQVFLRNLGAEAGEGTENLQAASDHYEECDGIDPVTQPHQKGMLVDGTGNYDGFVAFIFVFWPNDFYNCAAHFRNLPS
jgi:hypothetical protein